MIARTSKLYGLAIAGLFVVFAGAALASTVAGLADDPVLRDRLDPQFALDLQDADPDEVMTCLVILESPGRDPYKNKNQMPIPLRIELYRRLAFAMQSRFLDELAEEEGVELDVLDQYWLLNAMVVEGKPKQIRKVARRKKVRKLSRGGQIRLIDPAGSTPVVAAQGTAWNVAMVGADEGWERGYDGSGVVIGHLDTGVDVNHPALAGKWAGHWFDAIDGRSSPYDDHGHGTHTLGTLLGGDGDGAWDYDIGVAPGARWVGAKVLDDKGNGSYRQCLRGLEYIVGLKTEGVDVRIVCGSWTLDDMGRDVLLDVCNTLLELDVLPIFAVGNDGPGPGTVDVPGSYPSVLAVGAVDDDGVTPQFSSRGPAPVLDSGLWDPLVPNSRNRKPDLAAPGVGICSAVPGGGYAVMSGSSMATPHVAGAAALLLEKDSSLLPREIVAALLGNTRPTTASSVLPDNTVGWGILDVQRALDSVEGTVQATSADPAINTVSTALNVKVGRGEGAIFSYALARGTAGTVEIYDLAGRLVQRLDVRGGGTSRDTYWNGADVRGRRVTSGVYVARLVGDGVTASRTFTLIR